MLSKDGSLLFKPCSLNEPAFYQIITTEPSLAPLKDVIPTCIGTLKLQGTIDPEGEISLDQSQSEGQGNEEPNDEYILFFTKSHSLVLKNLTHGFKRPNVMDIKIGRVLHDEFATPEKRARSEMRARTQTSWETGLRITGFSLCDRFTGSVITTPREYGRSLKATDHPEAIRRYLPIATSSPSALEPGSPSQAVEGSADAPDPTNAHGLPPSLLRAVIQRIHDEVAKIRNILRSVDITLIGSSLFIVYESDWDACREGLAAASSNDTESSTEEWEEENLSAESWTEVEDANPEDQEADMEDEKDYEDGGGSMSSLSSSESSSSDSPSRRRRRDACLVKLIDFGHTRYTPGRPVDEGVFQGLDNVLKLFEGRLKDLEGLEDPISDPEPSNGEQRE
ncbi:SAICAR synthase-like protein [Sistotremastrum suecicum HHB10207 ss-3]|uniref:Kinase n=1 Tax=Sistotremastrum suecicum HHB10207 ss-3 TaxID=1314776 RepID=A0A165YX17_9AGAM|nr:SAICAR synthase-like protein [Sistotremastrum suecicum HHB10207 ss-3]